jgi:glycogen synthase
MKICLVSPEHNEWGGIGHSLRRLATLLSAGHEVSLIHSGLAEGAPLPAPIPGVRESIADFADQATTAFACESHQRSAAVLTAIERLYGDAAPDYLEVCDYLGHGVVPLQARRAGHPLLRETLVGVRLAGTSELICLHDGWASTEMRFTAAMEREQFRLADRLLWRGGDSLDLYRRYYSDVTLPEAVRIRPPLQISEAAPSPPAREPGQPLRLLYVGRMQRSKGAIDLVEACMGLPDDGWELTMIGADTVTGPLGRSVRETIEALSADDPRVHLRGPVPHDELQGLWSAHDLLVIPSTFEVWSNVATEAMRCGLPILATPVGGPAEIVEPGVTGWHSDGLGSEALRRSLGRLLESRAEIERVRSSGAVFERLRRLTEPEQALRSYDSMLGIDAEAAAPRTPEPAGEPSVTGVIPYHRSSAYIEEAVRSLLEQTHPDLEVLIVNDGSFEPEDEILNRIASDARVRLVTQLNAGETAARNLGACLADGEYVVMLDADNVLEPEFVARGVDLLRREPNLAYVTSWLSYIESDGSPMAAPSAYAPLGNSVIAEDSANWDGDAMAVLPRRLFSELGYGYDTSASLQSDWALYRRLRGDGRFGAVIPERLARYRVHEDSQTKSQDRTVHERGWDESRLRRTMNATRWTVET